MEETHFHIEGLPPFDGDYPFDYETFTNRELHTIKQLSGVRAGEIAEAFAADDNDLLLAFAVISIQRKQERRLSQNAIDVLWDAPAKKIQLVIPKEAEASPPEQTPPSSPDESESGNEKNDSSGSDSSSDGGHLANGQSPTGRLVSLTGSLASAPPTSET